MPTSTVRIEATIGGLNFAAVVNRTAETEVATETTLLAGASGTLSTRTDNDTGVVTLTAGHGQTDGTFDIFWTGGSRRGMTGTVATNDLTLDGGAGDNLPVEDSDVTVCKQTEINIDVVGDDLTLMFVAADQRVSVDFQEEGGTSIAAVDVPANEGWVWADEQPAANPFASATIGQVMASSGSTTAATIKIGHQYSSVA